MNLATAAVLLLSPVVIAQTQTAPTGATGICKDGSFTTSAVKDGACRGHKGIQTWYSPSLPSLPAPTPASLPSLPAPTPATLPSRQAPSVTAVSSSLPAPSPAPAAAASLPAPASKTSLASRPAATLTQAPAVRPAPTKASSVPSMPAPQPAKPNIATERANLASMPQAEGGGPGLVWVNATSKVYHCPGSDFYGKTKSGAYMSEADAKAQGAHPNRNKPCS